MKRLGIVSFYDADGIADDYLRQLLDDLTGVLDELILVVNGEVNEDGRKFFEQYTEQIVLRENAGFDAGAYQEVLVKRLGEEGIRKWDEIVLCNDTFYGPFVPFSRIFREMSERRADFWGLNYIESSFLSYLQSYFLVFRKPVLANGDLFRYFRDGIDGRAGTVTDVYAAFEVGLFYELVKKGYRYASYVYADNYDLYGSADACIRKCGLPILKKKSFADPYCDQETMQSLLHYIGTKTGFDMKPALRNAGRLYGINWDISECVPSPKTAKAGEWRKTLNLKTTEEEIEAFLNQYPCVYIYGTGRIARKLWFVLNRKIQRFAGFIVSEGQNDAGTSLYGFPVRPYSEVPKGAAVLLGLGKESAAQVETGLKKGDRIFRLSWGE